jgi:methylated-DNA-[protein]-cysteine S-methyltransferase
MNYVYFDSPIGPLLIAGDAHAIAQILFAKDGKPVRPEVGWIESAAGPVGEAIRQLREYFAGRRREFDLPLSPQGTEFQKSVWRRLQEIPYGATISYGELAKRVGNANASRAVGAANGKNPLPIVVPCHRVIGANGKLVGFGGGLPVKQALLEIEAQASTAPVAGG